MEDRYLHLSAEEIAAEERFISVVRSGDKERLIEEWLSEHPDQIDKINLAQKLASITFEKTDKSDTAALWNRIDKSISEEIKPESRTISLSGKWIGWAAAIGIILLVAVPLFRNDAVEQVYAEKPENIFLSDQSKVSVNSGSMISYNSDSWEKNRTVALNGEAFFSVVKGKKFTVQTDMGSVEVLGTSFNVYQRHNVLQVECESGSVKVLLKDHPGTFILKAGDAVKMETGQKPLTSRILSGQKRSQWRDGSYYYKNSTLEAVFREMENVYQTQIIIPEDVNSWRYTGSFENKDIDKALESVLYPMRLRYTHENGKVMVFKD